MLDHILFCHRKLEGRYWIGVHMAGTTAAAERLTANASPGKSTRSSPRLRKPATGTLRHQHPTI